MNIHYKFFIEDSDELLLLQLARNIDMSKAIQLLTDYAWSKARSFGRWGS